MAASLAVAPPGSAMQFDDSSILQEESSSSNSSNRDGSQQIAMEEELAHTPAPAPAVPSMTLPFASARRVQPSLRDLSLSRHAGDDESDQSDDSANPPASGDANTSGDGEKHQPLHPQLRRISLYLFAHACTLGIMSLAVPALLLELHDDNSSDSAYAYSILAVVTSGLGFVVYPLLGTLSDGWGRKPFILLTLSGAALGYGLIGALLSWPALLAAAVVRGLTDLSYTMSWAVLGDVTPRSHFVSTYGRVAGAAGMGIVTGPLLALACEAAGSTRAAFLLAMGIEIANAVFIARHYRETLHYFTRRDAARALMLDAEAGPQRSSEQLLMPLERESLKQLLARRSLNPFRALRLLARPRALLLLSLALFFHFIAFSGSLSVLYLFTHERFGWSSTLNGALVFSIGAMSILSNALCLPWVLRRGWMQERGVLSLSVAGTLAFQACLATIPGGSAGFALFPAAVIFAPGFFLLSNLRALLSRQLPPQLQGELQGALTCLSSLASIIGPLSLNAIFGYCVSKDAPVYLPGVPYIITFCLNCLSAGLILYVHHKYPHQCAKPSQDEAAITLPLPSDSAVLAGASNSALQLPDRVSVDSDATLGAPSPRMLHLHQSMIETRRGSLASDVDASNEEESSNRHSPSSKSQAYQQPQATDMERTRQ